ncbi:cobalamin biosynthesis bifunctional protein CbiET [Merismopedia glauca CCAP 1448/3]|uniref:Cobalamin biosynthesis bifunctional protein CbiET n=1 Tax=Merismopedia glauca CCAP 1448/3 TaxID=1296344 RepID=A0A2T1C6J0_9CYAN|nr:cobalamin biosynthesis bifunctional protein CbiET [Merismopedia glauca CCAP 1448/3]
MNKWLSVVGIGEDGLEGLSAIAKLLVDRAKVIVGGDRHLNMLPAGDLREKIVWNSPIESSIQEIISHKGEQVCVLASGDPMCYGIGVTLLRQIDIGEMTIIPAPSAFSLACARLGWSLTEVEMVSLCGRDPAIFNGVIYPGAKLLILSAGNHTPKMVADMLTQKGFGSSQMTVLERMGGVNERTIEGIAGSWTQTDLANLNTIAISCSSEPNTQFFSRFAGLPDSAYHHDGQLTKREVRAITLSALAPLPGQLLWDVGAGCGSIGIEWMRSHSRCVAIAIEHHPTRLQYIADNATALGTPNLKIVAGKAPTALANLPQPDAIFIGGGLTAPEVFTTCWQNLKIGGRLVANAVTVESEQMVFQLQHQFGGELTRIAIQRAESIGKFLGWKAMAGITQWVVVKNPE